MNKCALAMAAITVCMASSAAPVVDASSVTMTQLPNRNVVVKYRLTGEDAIVTLDIEKRDAAGNWASIGVPLQHVTGDVNRKVARNDDANADDVREIQWAAAKDWPDQVIKDQSVRAKVTAWALTSPPDYMVLDLNTFNQFFYTSTNSLPYGLSNSIYRTTMLVMRKIPAAGVTFLMGQATNTSADVSCRNCFLPSSAAQHWVSFTNDYYMAIYETTQKQNKLLRGDNNSNSATGNDEAPVDAMAYVTLRGTVGDGIDWPTTGTAVGGILATFRTRTGVEFDLPTEAEWEFACRAGTLTAFSNGEDFYGTESGCASLGDIGWYKGNLTGTTETYSSATRGGLQVVGQKAPNPWGLYDMHGNASEWCKDYAAPYDVSVQPAVAPGGPTTDAGYGRIKRSGTWFTAGVYTASSARRSTGHINYSLDDSSGKNVWSNGYRLVCPAVAK